MRAELDVEDDGGINIDINIITSAKKHFVTRYCTNPSVTGLVGKEHRGNGRTETYEEP